MHVGNRFDLRHTRRLDASAFIDFWGCTDACVMHGKGSAACRVVACALLAEFASRTVRAHDNKYRRAELGDIR